MDTGETYIKMCLKATEIQALAPEYNDKDFYGASSYVEIAWLPRQDQLQDMLGLFWWSLPKLCKEWFFEHLGTMYSPFTDVTQKQPRPIQAFDSMEQLWLGLVMKQKYHKTWDGNDWV